MLNALQKPVHEQRREKRKRQDTRKQEMLSLQAGVKMRAGPRNGKDVDEKPADDASMSMKLRYRAQVLLNHKRFDSAVGLVILLNSITIGAWSCGT